MPHRYRRESTSIIIAVRPQKKKKVTPEPNQTKPKTEPNALFRGKTHIKSTNQRPCARSPSDHRWRRTYIAHIYRRYIHTVPLVCGYTPTLWTRCMPRGTHTYVLNTPNIRILRARARQICYVSTHNTGTGSTSALGVCRCTVLSLARMDGCVRDDDDRDDDGHGTW